VVFQLPHLLQKLATSVFSPQAQRVGRNLLVDTIFLQCRHDQRYTGIRTQRNDNPSTAAMHTAPTVIQTSCAI
jgi:hypothetical protein